jgi:hypothetical protein
MYIKRTLVRDKFLAREEPFDCQIKNKLERDKFLQRKKSMTLYIDPEVV